MPSVYMLGVFWSVQFCVLARCTAVLCAAEGVIGVFSIPLSKALVRTESEPGLGVCRMDCWELWCGTEPNVGVKPGTLQAKWDGG